MESVPDSLSATEQSILISSVASNTTLPPDSNSSELPAGIFTSLTRNDVPFATLLGAIHFTTFCSHRNANVQQYQKCPNIKIIFPRVGLGGHRPNN